MQTSDNRFFPTAALRRHPALLLLVALLLALLAGCGGGGGGGGGTAKTTVTGQVLDSAHADAPVGGATVSIGGVSTTTTLSTNATTANPVGSFTLNNAPIGSTTATITVAGQAAQQVSFTPSITAGTNPSITLYINIGQISGTLLLANGAPAGGAFVSDSANGDTTQANVDGTFLLTNVPLGTTTLVAVLGTESLSKTVTVSNGVTALGSLKLADSPTGSNPPAPPYTIVGKVTLGGSGNGAAANGAQVFLLSGGAQVEVTTADATGQYTFYVPLGTYQLQFKANGYQVASENVTVNNPAIPLTAPTAVLTPQ